MRFSRFLKRPSCPDTRGVSPTAGRHEGGLLRKFGRWIGWLPALTTAEQYRALFSPTSRLRPRWTSPQAWRFVLLTDAKGRSLVWRNAKLFFRRSA